MYKIDKIAFKFTTSRSNASYSIDLKDYVIKNSVLSEDNTTSIYTTDYYQSFKAGTYNQNIKFTEIETEAVLHLGYDFNSFGGDDSRMKACKVEFNPQKIKQIPKIVTDFITLNRFKMTDIPYIDFAFDIKKPLSDITIVTQKYKMSYGPASNTTLYIQPNVPHGRIKIYDKAKEQKQPGVLTRVEMSAKMFPGITIFDAPCDTDVLYLEDLDKRLREVYIKGIPMKYDSLVEKYGRYDKSTLYALDNLDNIQKDIMLGMMSEATRAKYRAYLKASSNHNLAFSFVESYKHIKDDIIKILSDVGIDILRQV